MKHTTKTREIEKIGIQAFDVYDNDQLVDEMIMMCDKINEIIEALNSNLKGEI